MGGYNYCFHLVFEVLISFILNNCMGVPLILGRFFGGGYAGCFLEYTYLKGLYCGAWYLGGMYAYSRARSACNIEHLGKTH